MSSPSLAATVELRPLEPVRSERTTVDSPGPDPAAAPLEERIAVASTLTSDGRVAPSRSPTTRSPLAATTGAESTGTVENPLIPKRRRRTSPTELAILEEEYQRNPRPDQPERAKIAQRLGMTNRSIQVWYQNRRQKDKKDSSSNAGSSRSSSVPAGDLSSPKDLDGVTLSFSSSPAPPPHYPLLPSARPPLVAKSSLRGLPSSSDLYSNAPAPSSVANKENDPIHLVDTKPATEPIPKPYVYSYPSSQEVIASGYQYASSSGSASVVASTPQHPVFLHRSSDSSIIAAKKHVRKRPLGSHAPVARTPSLSHAFAFPPSPPKAKPCAPGPVRSSSLPSTTAAQINLADLSARRPDLVRRSSSLNSASSGLSAFDTVADASVKAETTAEDAAPRDAANGARKAAADDLLQHMQSDPPSASSPAPIARTRVYRSNEIPIGATDEESDEDGKPFSGSFVASAFAARRPPLQHSQSLGASPAPRVDTEFRRGDPSKAQARVALLRSNSFSGTSSSSSDNKPSSLTISPSLANAHARSNPFSPLSAPLSSRTITRKSPSLSQTAEAARAGTDNACALTALERKRARIISDGLPLSLPALPPLSSLSSASRKRSSDSVKDRATTKRRRSSALSSISNHADADDSLGDLSFSSTSTASTVDSLATVDSPPPPHAALSSGYFALRNAVEQVEAKDSALGGAGDDERECAELLLGLGGFC
ncbi:hypothetical protein JCM3766R1_006909 [Sporobolomyces carnicolor]